MTNSSTVLELPPQPQLDDKTRASIRLRAKRDLSNLDAQLNDSDHDAHTNRPQDDDDPHRCRKCEFFETHGFLFIESFAETVRTDEVSDMKSQMKHLVEGHWNPNNNDESDDSNNGTEKKKLSVFSTDEKEQINEQGSDDYFLDSANKIHFFAETVAVDQDKGGGLKPEFANDKMGALNKAGHGMHTVPGAFHDYTTSRKVKNLVKELGWTDPVVPQSMYIFKQPRIGGEVTSHQDSTFLYTTPRQTCLGLWLALDDATIDNGCLWVRPGSHRETVRRKFVRNPAYFGREAIETRSNIANGDMTTSKLVFLEESTYNEPKLHIPWEGKIPGSESCSSDTMPWDSDSLFDAGFIPIECKAGDLIAFPGRLDHLSLPNFSTAPRHTFQLHLVEGENAGITWSKSNWLQYPRGVPFLGIN